MLRETVMVLLVVGVLASAGQALASPFPIYPGKEHFDDYATGTDDPNYLANWPTVSNPPAYEPGPWTRYAIGTQKPWSTPNNLWLVDTEGTGIVHDLRPDILEAAPGMTAWNGTADTPLHGLFSMWSKNKTAERKYASVFVELSLGEVHAPDENYSGPTLPVIAYGWARGPINGTSITPYFFDGAQWKTLSSIDQSAQWNNLDILIYDDHVVVENLKFPDVTETEARVYLGPFDHISIMSPNNDASERAIDDVWLVDGVFVPGSEPEGACCLGDGSCVQASNESECTGLGGIYAGNFTSCETAVCTGACCPLGIMGDCEATGFNQCDGNFQGVGTTCDTVECPCPDPFADVDGDGDVDQADFGVFQLCFTGRGGGVPAGCECLNHDVGADDPDIDEDDWGAFEDCASGPDVPADPSCDGVD